MRQTIRAIVEVINRLKVTLTNSSGTEIGTVSNPVVVVGSGGGASTNVVVTSSALPPGASTAALQTSGNASLTTIAAVDFATQTTLAAMNAKFVTGTDIGDVTINNGAGAAAVNVQDGGNSLTVDGDVSVTTVKPDGTNTMPSLDTAARSGYVRITDGTETVDVEVVDGMNAAVVTPHYEHAETVVIDLVGVAATTGYMVIDLSDTTNWPHTETGQIHINGYTLNINPSAAFVGDISFGFLTSVDADNGDFNLLRKYSLNNASTEIIDGGSFPDGIVLSTSDWFGPTTANSTVWQTDVNLIGPNGGAAAYPSGDGDLVMLVTRTAGTVDINLMVHYHTIA